MSTAYISFDEKCCQQTYYKMLQRGKKYKLHTKMWIMYYIYLLLHEDLEEFPTHSVKGSVYSVQKDVF